MNKEESIYAKIQEVKKSHVFRTSSGSIEFCDKSLSNLTKLDQTVT